MTSAPMVDLSELDPDFAEHLSIVAEAIIAGQVVPVLGAGANLCDRGPGEAWEEGKNLPSGAELSLWLADKFKVRVSDRSDLVRVSQYANLTRGEGPLYERLNEVFLKTYEITSLHEFLAWLPGWLAQHREPGARPGTQLIVSTNYDDLAERALQEKGVEFDLVRYCANGPNQGLFVHVRPDGSEEIIRKPNEYLDVDPAVRTVLLKIHGTIVRASERQDSYVITEDHYIEYLAHTNPSELFPAAVLAKLVNSSFLFLGYGMRDWNLRVLLHRILNLRAGVGWQSWAVQKDVDRLDVKLWTPRGVELQEHGLSEYIAALRAALKEAVA